MCKSVYKATPPKEAWQVRNAVFVVYQTILASVVLVIRLESLNIFMDIVVNAK